MSVCSQACDSPGLTACGGDLADVRAGLDASIWVSVDRFYRVLAILIDNAVAFTSEGTVWVGAARRDGELVFWVEDTGVGISESDRVESLTPSSSSMSPPPARTRARGWGWPWPARSSSCTAEPSRSRLAAEVGAAEGRMPSLSDTDDTSDIVPLRVPMQVLVVDDNPVNLLLARRMPERLGHRALTATGSKAHAQMVQEPLTDLILMDIRMPGEDGIVHATASRGQGATGPILAFTADAAQRPRPAACRWAWTGC